jgi:hypothetical protein
MWNGPSALEVSQIDREFHKIVKQVILGILREAQKKLRVSRMQK